MPLYDYACTKCGEIIEVEHSIKEEPAQVAGRLTCPKGCIWEPHESGVHFRRCIGRSNFALQGSGWSRDGYR